MSIELNEPITVGAVFAPGRIRPAWFIWRGRKYPVDQVAYDWESREGLARLCHFSVVSGANVYAIAYNPVGKSWELRGVEQDWRG